MKRIIIFFTLSLLFTLGVSAQTLSTDTFNTANGNLPSVGGNLDVPVDVTGIGTIYILTVYVEYDLSVLTYTGFTDVGIAGATTTITNEAPNVLKLVIASTAPFQPITIADGKWLDLHFNYLGGYTDLLYWTTTFGTYASNIFHTDFTAYDFVDADVTNGAVGDYIISGGDWHTASNWNANAVPTAAQDAYVAPGTETTIGAAAVVNNLTIMQGGQLTNNSSLSVGGDFMIESDVAGSGSFIDNGTLTVGGTSLAQCYVTNGQWHGISAPVSGEDFSAMYLDQNPKVWIRSFDESTDTYTNMDDTTQMMGDMQGWFTWIESASVPQTFTFEGAFRTGTVGSANNMDYSLNGWNFVGNPFTSAIDWDAGTGWTKTNVNNAIYVYSSPGWATYVGGVGANGGTQYVAMNQGFFVQATATGTLTMDNDVAVHNAVGYLKSEMAEQQIVRLQLEDAGIVDETVIRFTNDATADFDGNYDAHKLFPIDNTEYPQIYSTTNNFMSINSLPFEEMIKIPMDVRGTNGNSMTITATESEDFAELYLYDSYTGESENLKENAYTFIYDADFTDRFTLSFSTLGEDENLAEDAAKIFAYDKNIQVVLNGLDHANIEVYNLLGQVIATGSANSNVTRIQMNKTGYFLVKVTDGKFVTTKKVFIK